MKFFKNFTIKMVKMNFIFCWVCIYINYQIKKCIYNKKNVCICVWGDCLDKYISAATLLPNKNS